MQFAEDRISSLPDEILLIILSFLTVKDMTGTSLLSKRWLNLWVNTQGPYSIEIYEDPTLVLKYLHIQYCFELKDLSISNINIVSLDISYGDLKQLTLKDLPMLVELSIAGYPTNIRHILSQNATCLPQLEALTLVPFQLKELTMLSDLPLTNLKRLAIMVGATRDESLADLFSLVIFCPHLAEFGLTMFWLGPKRTGRTMREVERLSSKSKSLKGFEFKGYYGRVCDIEFVMHVVENAPALEKIIIDTCEFRKHKHRSSSVIDAEMEARSIALNQFEHLRESKCIPPHVDVLIRPVAVTRRCNQGSF